MVDVTPVIPFGRQVVESYGGGRFRISGTVHGGSVIVFPDRTLAWAVGDIAEVDLDSLAAVTAAEAQIDILLLGCGRRLVPVRPDLRKALRAAGIVVDPMDTGAACRTYNVLLAEERRVAAALIAMA